MSKLVKSGCWLGVVAVQGVVLSHWGVEIGEIVRFVAAVTGGALLPGLLLLHWLDPNRTTAYRFLLALVLGICLDILLYLLLVESGGWVLIYPLLAGILIVYVKQGGLSRDVALLFQAGRSLSLRFTIMAAAILFLLLYLTVIFFFVPAPLPGEQAVVYHVDIPWHLGNAAEIYHHGYPQDPRLAGHPFHYHIFFHVWLAFLARLGGLGLPVVYLRLVILCLIYVLAAGAYFSGSRWFGNRRAGVWHVVVVFFMGTALLSWPNNLFLRNLFISPTFLLALVLLLPLLVELRGWWMRPSTGRLVIILGLTFGLSGAKGSFMPVVLAAVVLTWGYGWLKGPSSSSGWLAGAMTAVFLLVFVWIFRGIGSEGLQIVPWQVVIQTARYAQYADWLPDLSPPWLLIAFLPAYFVLFFSFRLIFLGKELSEWWKNRRSFSPERVFLAGLFAASVIPGYLLSYRGSSQYYFLLVGYAGLNLMASGYLAEWFSRQRSAGCRWLAGLLILLSLLDTVITIQHQDYLNTKFAGIRNKPVTPSVYQALDYVRRETNPDAVLASYRSFWLNDRDPRFFYYSAFSERRVVVEGWMYMSSVYQEEAQERYRDMQVLFTTRSSETARQIIRRHGIDYILVNKLQRQRLRFPLPGVVERVYANADMEVYRSL